jgi:ABC-type phosphate transport system substrate-binding protein
MKPKLNIIFIFLFFVGIALTFPCAASTEEAVVIIANENVPTSSLSIHEIRNIFLSKKTRWRGSSRIKFVVLNGGDVHNDFLKSYLGKTKSQYDNYYKNLVFEGKGKAPRAFSTEAEVVSYVSSTEGAIGYVSSGTNTQSAKIVIVK